MGIKLTKLPQLSCETLSDREILLWQLLREREECIQELVDEIARLKGEKGKPKIKPSRLEPEQKAQAQQEETAIGRSIPEANSHKASGLRKTAENG